MNGYALSVSPLKPLIQCHSTRNTLLIRNIINRPYNNKPLCCGNKSQTSIRISSWSLNFDDQYRAPLSKHTPKVELKVKSSAAAVPQSESNDNEFLVRSLQIGSMFAIWYLLNISFNIYNKQVATSMNMVASVLSCLSHAPRLPPLDWRAIIGRCMKSEGQAAQLPAEDSAFLKGIVLKECLLFLLAHANQSDALLSFLDELYDLTRFRTLEPNLQSIMLLHVGDLVKIFSISRLGKLFDDLVVFVPWSASSDWYNQEQKSSLRVSCWKGLLLCLDESILDTQGYTPNLQTCMEVLFTLLPWSCSADTVGLCKGKSDTEWDEAIRCLAKAQQAWLFNLFLISDANFTEKTESIEILKKIQAKTRLVRIGVVSSTELGKLKALILSSRAEVIWDVLVEVAVTVQHAERSARIQWLTETVKISCVTSYPSIVCTKQYLCYMQCEGTLKLEHFQWGVEWLVDRNKCGFTCYKNAYTTV